MRCWRAYHTRAENPGARDVLLRLAGEVGLDVERARAVLDSDEFGAEVRERERYWQQRGINSVPAVVIDDRHLISAASRPRSSNRPCGGSPPATWTALREGREATIRHGFRPVRAGGAAIKSTAVVTLLRSRLCPTAPC